MGISIGQENVSYSSWNDFYDLCHKKLIPPPRDYYLVNGKMMIMPEINNLKDSEKEDVDYDSPYLKTNDVIEFIGKAEKINAFKDNIVLEKLKLAVEENDEYISMGL